jgi:oxygen-dependent protoporphyrinogen oxidase
MNAPASLRVTVVGGGIAGLSCAARLKDLARERGFPLDLTLLEAGPRPGGVVVTERVDGFLIEGGPDCFISEKPWAVDLCRRLGLGDQILGTNPDCRRSFVLQGRRLLPIPEGYQLIAPSRFLPFATSPILSPLGKLRAACDLLLPRGADAPDESLASFVRRRFGAEVLERLAQPLLAGIYNADPERLSLRATMPRFLEMERVHRSVILALLRARRNAGGRQKGVSGARYSLFVTLRDGLQSLVERLAAGLPPRSLRLGVRVAGVTRAEKGESAGGPGGGWVVSTDKGERIRSEAVVLAMPAHAASSLARGADPGLAGALGAIPYGTSVTVSLGYSSSDLPRPVDGFGFVIPRSEARPLIACSFSSTKFAGRAPAGTALLRTFLGGPATEGMAPESLERSVRDQLRDILGVTAAPLVARTHVWPRAMAQYEVGHLERVAAIERTLDRLPGLALAGNGLFGVGIPDCVRSGEMAAERVAALAGRKDPHMTPDITGGGDGR